jgi:pimeloyl-ACP methyl ester carboxylesterase
VGVFSKLDRPDSRATMKLVVGGNEIYAATGGRTFDPKLPLVVFLHGAGFDHTVWHLLARWFAHRGASVLAPDLPGHGLSAGQPLRTIAAMADWTAALIAAAGAMGATIFGHSMGSLVALETAARHHSKVTALALICTAAEMRVSQALLDAAKADDHAAIDMVNLWGHGQRASLGGCLAPGVWMLGGGEKVLERAAPGVLHTDLAACNDYKDALSSAAKVKVPVIVVMGERDLMTPAKSGRELAAAISGARAVILPGAGHMLMSERSDEVLAAVRHLAPRQPVTSP